MASKKRKAIQNIRSDQFYFNCWINKFYSTILVFVFLYSEKRCDVFQKKLFQVMCNCFVCFVLLFFDR
jgi:hypothetical protein